MWRSSFIIILAASLSACIGQQAKPTVSSVTTNTLDNAETYKTNNPVVQQVNNSDSSIVEKDLSETELQQEPDLALIPGVLPPPAEQAVHPLDGMNDAAVEDMLLTNKAKLGSASIGGTSGGALFGGVQMQDTDIWNVVNPKECWGTKETVQYLTHAITRVNERFPGTPRINIGDISAEHGGHLRPHVSHQSGRDVDVGFYYLDGSRWYSKANIKNLDVVRTWALLRHTITETDIQVIFLDHGLQKILRNYAAGIGENEKWLDQVFGGPSSNLRPMIIHEKGHHTHLHFRYYSPIAQETGRRVQKALMKHKKIKPQTYFVRYKVKRGDSLNRLAKRFKTKVSILKKVNGLRTSRIIAGHTYKIPRKGGRGVRLRHHKRLILPARRIPPQPESVALKEGAGGTAMKTLK